MSSYVSATDADRREMLEAIGLSSIEELFADIPAVLRLDRDRPLSMEWREAPSMANGIASRGVTVDLSSLEPGRYSVRLQPGYYSVRTAAAPKIGSGMHPRQVHVLRGVYGRVDFSIDTGIR